MWVYSVNVYVYNFCYGCRKVESELQSGRYSAKDEKKLQNEIASLKEAKSKVS